MFWYYILDMSYYIFIFYCFYNVYHYHFKKIEYVFKFISEIILIFLFQLNFYLYCNFSFFFFRIAKREKYSRRRTHNDDADIDYINDRNMKFNNKLERFYGQYTTEIKQNLERGTAV